LGQNFDDYEVIIVDGASTDSTPSIIRDYESKFSGKLRWISEKDTGIYSAVNKGIKIAQGDFLNIIGAGDWLEVDAIEMAYECADAHPEADAVYGKTRIWDKNIKTSRLVQTSVEMLPVHPMQHPSLFYKKSLHDKFGFYDESYKIAADYEFCLKAFYQGKSKVTLFNAIIDNFVMGGISSANHLKTLKENRRALHKVGLKQKDFLCQIITYYKKKIFP